MDETIPYYGDLHIDEGTKKLILNLLSSIRSVVPVASPPEPGSQEEESGNPDLEHIKNVLVLARQHSKELDGLFNPDELLKYARYASDYQDITRHLKKTLRELEICRDSALRFASGMAEMVEDHLHMVTPPKRKSGNGKRQESIRINNEGIKLKVV